MNPGPIKKCNCKCSLANEFLLKFQDVIAVRGGFPQEVLQLQGGSTGCVHSFSKLEKVMAVSRNFSGVPGENLWEIFGKIAGNFYPNHEILI